MFLIFCFNTKIKQVVRSKLLKTIFLYLFFICIPVICAAQDNSEISKIKIKGQKAINKAVIRENMMLESSSWFKRKISKKEPQIFTPELLPGSAVVKDAYVVLNDRWSKAFSIWAGKFNRPNYEVEYSSSSRELAERSLVIRTLYPSERAIGAKLEYNPLNVPIHLQFALINGNEAITINNASGVNLNSNENKDFDNYKDIMVRATYNLQLRWARFWGAWLLRVIQVERAENVKQRLLHH